MDNSDVNILLLVFDTVRADALSVYDGPVETNAMEEIASSGTTFDQAFAAGPGTPMSHGAMFTGQYPSETGILGPRTVSENLPIMAEWFQNRGYETFGIPGPAKISSDYGYDRGFNQYFETYTDDFPEYKSSTYIKRILTDSTNRLPLLRELIRTITKGRDSHTSFKFDILKDFIENSGGSPFFAFMNTTVAHLPYNPPRPYKQQFTPELNRPRYAILESLLGREQSIKRPNVRSDRLFELQTSEGISKYIADPQYASEEEMDVLRQWYYASIKYLDDQLSQFLQWLDDSGLLNNTIIICTADHGEHFGEHDMFTHSHYLYEQTLHVPLIISGPEVPKDERRSDLVSLVDLFDTLCDLTQTPLPDTTSGQSMFCGKKRNHVFAEYGIVYDEPSGHARYLEDDEFESFRAGRKVIINEEYRYEVSSNGEERIFQRSTDTEIENPNPDRLRELREILEGELGEEFGYAHEEVEHAKKARENLRKLGYID